MLSRYCAVALALAAIGAAPRALAQAAAPEQANAQHRYENGEGLARQPAAIAWALTYNSDLNADVGGGLDPGGAYLQRVGLIADADLGRLAGWRGATAHLSVHSIAGTGLSARRVGNLLTVSGVEAEPALRLFNLWVEQGLGERVKLRVGQFTAGQEFAISSTAGLFVNSTFGWPGSFAIDLPSGGPAYPLAAPGARLAWQADDKTMIRVALFSGDPAGKGDGDPQRRDRHGFNGFRLKGKPFVIGELARSAGGDDPGWSVAVGGWMHFDEFDDQRFDAAGRRLASPLSSGRPRRHDGNYAAYAIAEGRLWRAGWGNVRGFVRASISPTDRNPIDLYLDGGLTIASPFRSRPSDLFGLGVGIARLSPRVRSAIEDRAGLNGVQAQPPSFEGVIEASYQWRLKSGIYLQPNAQLILHPAGALLADTTGLAAKPRRSIVVGVRTSVRL